MKAPTESDLVRDALQYLQLRGWLAWRSNNVSVYDSAIGRCRKFRGLRGVADILAVLPPNGRLLAVECKMPAGKLSKEQAAFLDCVRSNGGLAFVVRSVGELIDALKAEGM